MVKLGISMKAFVYLIIIAEPITHIEGLNGRGSELFIKAGSTINLTCIVEDATDNAPKHILWRHNARVSTKKTYSFFDIRIYWLN